MEPTSRLSLPALFAIGLVILVLRAPGYFITPQFWGEDGRFWFANAYEAANPLLVLFTPEFGYINLYARLVGALAQLFPLVLAPSVFLLGAAFVQLSVLGVLGSRALARQIPDSRARLLLAVTYLAAPNSAEVQLNLTNAHTHLALLQFLLLISLPPCTLVGRLLVGIVLVVGALSGPFAIFLSPIALYLWMSSKPPRKDGWWRYLIPIVGGLAQGACVLLSGEDRFSELGATLHRFFQIIGGQIGISSIIGIHSFSYLSSIELLPSKSVLLVGGVTCGVLIFTLLRGPIALRLFVAFSMLSLAAALLSPKAAASGPQWMGLIPPGHGNRYFVLPGFAFVLSLLWLVNYRSPNLRGAKLILVGIFAGGVISDYRLPPRIDYNYTAQVADFERLPSGTTGSFQIPPGWYIQLIKR